MGIRKKPVERKERVLVHADLDARNARTGRARKFFSTPERAGKEASDGYRDSENGRGRIERMRNANREYVGVLQNLPDSGRKIRMEVGDEKHRGLGTDFFNDLGKWKTIRHDRGKRLEIVPEGIGEPSDVPAGKRGLQEADSISSERDGSSAVSGTESAGRNEFENRDGLVETRRASTSESHGSGNVNYAPDRYFPIGNERFHEGFSASETRLPIYRAGVVRFGIRPQSPEFDALARKYRSVLSGRKRYGIAEFGKVEEFH